MRLSSDEQQYDVDTIPVDKDSESGKPWGTYGLDEPAISEFVSRHRQASISVDSIDLSSDGVLNNQKSFCDQDSLAAFLASPQDPSSASLRILLVKELSGKALQMMSATLGIHTGFWAWVASDEAADGFWLNTHNDGKILSFDLPAFEFYSTAAERPTAKVVREGRLKHLSSRHRLFLSSRGPATRDVYINRRVSAYLIPGTNGRHTFIFFGEDCQVASSLPLSRNARTDPISVEWFLQTLRGMDKDLLKKYAEAPVGVIIRIVTRLLRTWHVFTVLLQRDLEAIDDSLPESLPTELPQHNLYDIGTYLHRDIVQTAFRFSHQLGKFEGYLRYLVEGTTEQFQSNLFAHDIANLNLNIADLQRRLTASKDRGNMTLTLINNYISLQQARLASSQAATAMQMAKVQQLDSQSARRLSIVATLFLPLSFASSWLSTNNTTPLWVFLPIAAISVLLTTISLSLLKWLEGGEESPTKRVVGAMLGPFVGVSTVDVLRTSTVQRAELGNVR